MDIKAEGVLPGQVPFYVSYNFKILFCFSMKTGAAENTNFRVTVTSKYPTLSKLNVLYEVPEIGQHVQARQYRRSVLEQAVPSRIHEACFAAGYVSTPTLLLSAMQVQILNKTGDSGSKPEQALSR
jgi:hypothetical protein